MSATGFLVALASPKAKNPPDLSSRCIEISNPSVWSAVTVRGVDREPGETATCSTPAACS